MQTYISLILTGLIPVIASAVLFTVSRYEKMQGLPYMKKQVLTGLIFGMIAIFGTEFGIVYNGTIINARDAAPLCAGLIFGAPAGIISGFIGGIERWFAVYWGRGYFTRAGCTISTCLTGLIAAGLKKYMFDDRIPSWLQAFTIGIVCEVVHMLMIFITNITDTSQAFTYVSVCTLPMVLINAASVAFAVYMVRYLEHKRSKEEPADKAPNISELFQKYLVYPVLIAYLVTSVFTYILQNAISSENTSSLLSQNLVDVSDNADRQCDEMIMRNNRHIAASIVSHEDEGFAELTYRYGAYEIDVIDTDGIIVRSNRPDRIGSDLDFDQNLSALFNAISTGGYDEYVSGMMGSESEPGLTVKYTGLKADDEIIAVIYDQEQYYLMCSETLPVVVSNRHIGKEGGLMILDTNYRPVAATESLLDDIITEQSKELKFEVLPVNEFMTYTCTIGGIPYYCMTTKNQNYLIASVLPVSEADFSKQLAFYLNFFLLSIVFGALFVMIYIIIRNVVVGNIQKVNRSLAAITEGNLDTSVDVRSSQEFIDLSDDINETVGTLKHYIAEANERIDAELKTAREIQASALPSVFPDREEVDLYALMDPAKEVGGDFYDFYWIGKNKLVFLAADVSGKGIPASLFMMRAKTTLKSYAESRIAVSEVFTNANNQLCEGNDAMMFVTAWMGILDLETGELKYANAGHNPPLIRRKNGRFEYLKGAAGFVLAGMEGIRYKEQSVILEPGDEIFLYTDGVVEATNPRKQLYGEERLQKCLNRHIGSDAKTICLAIRKDVDIFDEDAPQFDDITEVSLKFLKYGEKNTE